MFDHFDVMYDFQQFADSPSEFGFLAHAPLSGAMSLWLGMVLGIKMEGSFEPL